MIINSNNSIINNYSDDNSFNSYNYNNINNIVNNNNSNDNNKNCSNNNDINNNSNTSENNIKTQKSHKSRNSRVLWYNPPYCSSIKINLGKEFLRLVDKYFPDNHCYRKMFNRKTLKISYSCMNNVKSII